MIPFQDVIATERELRDLVGTPASRSILKERPALDAHCRAFIALSPLVLIGTSGTDGRCDVSPKGDAPGFVLVLDDRRLVIPDRPGNKRLDGMSNLLQNPHVGTIFLIPGREETLRVNGRASIIRDAEILELLTAHDKRPLVAIGVEVEECFFHCPKAFRRAGLWDPERWLDRAALPSMARVLFDQVRPAGKTVEEYERESEEGLKRTLY